MKRLFYLPGKPSRRGGFSLVETTFSLGLFSFGFLSLVPLLTLGLKNSRQARDDRMTAQIAQTLMEEARQGSPDTCPAYFDSSGLVCSPGQAAFSATGIPAPSFLGNPQLTQLTLLVTPTGAPERARAYAVVYAAPAP